MSGTVVLEEKWPVLGRHGQAAAWLRVWTDLGRAHVGNFVRELPERPSRRGVNVVSLDSGSGLANATIQQRLVPVRLFYDHLMEEGLRESNPVGRGVSHPAHAVAGISAGWCPG
ncbi:integrase [Rhodococcus wratislaviensis]|uniref:Putative transposase n=1 Tax=Rhodococcus wratislaviensis NBRC 100605 TaxID=1219028 RepID=X0Q0H9_RHOWR|nr:integrase [Rhodococcus wratislaviensis]GAF43646.1 putative transposase [Rhodococcus wratislaviensis NBRC 100605]